ncbi:Rab family GTPase [Yasminevirus sp. GU-2018]|uniref:Rab family GTPase n=1 Tax=Yasminevirus sp. GU-2018 TaxID=2420051 RepID=A0A5K0UC80_9VIRU|nr:Rab family GTPase [Yasminevirus sp. GU-2018]
MKRVSIITNSSDASKDNFDYPCITSTVKRESTTEALSSQNTNCLSVRSKTYKVIMIGDSGVGKSCLALRFVTQCFREKLMSTIGASFYTKDLYNENEKIMNKFQI